MFDSCAPHYINDSCSLWTNYTQQQQLQQQPARYRFDVDQFIELYVISLLIVVGVAGNVISVLVLHKDRERRDALLLLQALAVADLFYVLVAALRYPLKHLMTYERWLVMQPVVFPLLKVCQTATIWMMVLVTVDRYVCVCRSLEAPNFFNRCKRLRYAALVFLAALLYNLPRFFDSHVCRWHEQCSGRVLTGMTYRHVFFNKYYMDIYQVGLYLLLLYVWPLGMLGYFNCKLVQAIRYSKKRYRMSSRLLSSTTRTNNWSTGQLYPVTPRSTATPSPVTGSDKNATIVLIVIVIVFVFCETPELLIRFVTFTERNFSYELLPADLGRLHLVGELLMVVNSTVNFVVYLAFGRRFRRILRETFRFSFRFSKNSTTTTTDDSAPRHHNCIHAPTATARLHRI